MGARPLWLSFDVEATGPTAGLHSMVSLGIVALEERRLPVHGEPDGPGHLVGLDVVDTFEILIEPHPDFSWQADTERWWLHADRAEAYRATFDPKRQIPPVEAMSRTCDFLHTLKRRFPGQPHVYAAYPGSFDMPMLRYYMERFMWRRWTLIYPQDSVMERIACFDMGSLGMSLLGVDYHDVSSGRMASAGWEMPENPLPHTALHDAIEQGQLLGELLVRAELRERQLKMATRSLENVRLLAMRLVRAGVSDAHHLLRFCREAGVEGSVLREQEALREIAERPPPGAVPTGSGNRGNRP